MRIVNVLLPIVLITTIFCFVCVAEEKKEIPQTAETPKSEPPKPAEPPKPEPPKPAEPPKPEPPKPAEPPKPEPPKPAEPPKPEPPKPAEPPKPEPPKPAEPPKPEPPKPAEPPKPEPPKEPGVPPPARDGGASGDVSSPFDLSDAESKAFPTNSIDKPVLDLLAQKKIEPARVCSDAVFLRRVYLDLIGTVPTHKEATDFLDDKSPDKRSKLIDALLKRPEFVEYWSLKFGDMLRIKAEFPINLWPNGAMVYHRWIRESVRLGKPYDKMVRELLLGSGSNFRNPPANFYRAVQNRDAASTAEAVALTFMGVRFDKLSKEQQDQMAVFFSRVAIKGSAEWKEEIVYWIDKPLENPNVVFLDGKTATVAEGQDPRNVFADWLVTPENPWFVRSTVNRIWFWFFGRGIVHEPDDFRADNPPGNPALLDLLAKEFVQSKYDLKTFLRLILNSRTYQQSSIPASTSQSNDPELSAALFAVYPVRQIDAEVLHDMLRQILAVNLGYTSDVPEPFTNIPDWQRTILLPDGSITNPFLETFGRPPRDSGVLSERNLSASASQRMFLINSSDMMRWIEQSWRLRNAANAAASKGKPEERRPLMLRYLWLTILTRYPTQEEIDSAKALFEAKGANETVVYQDILWTLLNTKEFLCRH